MGLSTIETVATTHTSMASADSHSGGDEVRRQRSGSIFSNGGGKQIHSNHSYWPRGTLIIIIRFPLETPMLLIRWWTTQSTTPNVQATLMRLHTTYLRRQHGYLLLKGKNAFHCVEELLRFHRIMHSIHFAHACPPRISQPRGVRYLT